MSALLMAGTWIETDQGHVEVSVFETGRPPEFRLYFYDTQKQAMPAAPYAATAETIRPREKRQVFEFRFELPDPQTVGKRSVDIHRLLGDAFL